MDAAFNKALTTLVQDIFACFLQADYETNLYLYEHRIHDSKNNCISLIQKRAKDSDVATMLGIYNGLLDCGLLRWRIKDKTAFGICRKELTDIRDALIALLDSCSSDSSARNSDSSSRRMPGPRDENFLNGKISALESVNQSVLQVAAKEPLAFLLFISGLKALQENYLAIHCIASA